MELPFRTAESLFLDKRHRRGLMQLVTCAIVLLSTPGRGGKPVSGFFALRHLPVGEYVIEALFDRSAVPRGWSRHAREAAINQESAETPP